MSKQLWLERSLPHGRRFTDKPIRRAGAFETAYFSSSDTFDSEGTWLGAPNAALTGTYDGQPYVVIVTLYSPIYDNKTHTLQYQVRHLSQGLREGWHSTGLMIGSSCIAVGLYLCLSKIAGQYILCSFRRREVQEIAQDGSSL